MPFLYCRNSSYLQFSKTIIASEIHGLRSLVKDISFSLIGQHLHCVWPGDYRSLRFSPINFQPQKVKTHQPWQDIALGTLLQSLMQGFLTRGEFPPDENYNCSRGGMEGPEKVILNMSNTSIFSILSRL